LRKKVSKSVTFVPLCCSEDVRMKSVAWRVSGRESHPAKDSPSTQVIIRREPSGEEFTVNAV